MILIANRPLTGFGELNQRSVLILSLFPGLQEWLTWAITDTHSAPLQAANEEQLLRIVLDGLHSDSFARFNTFRIHLNKLLEVNEADLHQLAVIQSAQHMEEAEAHIVSRCGLITYKDIADTLKFFESISHPLFRYPSFKDAIVLALFFKQLSPDQQQQKQGFDFALAHADSLPSFIDLFWFYTLVCAQLPAGLTDGYKLNACENMYQRLLPDTYHLLFTPNAGKDINSADIPMMIPRLALGSRFIGYDTVASAMHNLVRNITFSLDDNARIWQSMIEAHLAAVKSAAATQTILGGRASQAGNLRSYNISTDSGEIWLGMDDKGNLIQLPQTQFTLNQQTS